MHLLLGARGEGPLTPAAGARVLVVGFGNPLVADDGAGPAVVDRLHARLRARRSAKGLPEWLRVEEGGQDSLRLPALWGGEPRVWLVDAFSRGAPPGTIHRIDHEELLSIPQAHAGAHQLSLPESLRWLALADPEMGRVRYRLWGIEPARLAPGEGLSPAVARAVAAVALELERDLRAMTTHGDEPRDG